MGLFVKDREFYKSILVIGGPIAAQQVITVGVNMMDTVMLGQLNETALSASAAATQVHSLFQFMSMGLGMGASVLIARYWGAGELPSLRKALTLMYRFCLLISLTFTAVVGLAPAQVLSLLTPYPEVVAEGVRYLRWALPCFLLFGLSTTTIVLRNLKQMHIPLYVSIGAFLSTFSLIGCLFSANWAPPPWGWPGRRWAPSSAGALNLPPSAATSSSLNRGPGFGRRTSWPPAAT